MMLTEYPIHVVEAFTVGNNQPFTGNTAAVCILKFDDDINDELKQKIGMQMNIAETAFISQGWTKSNAFNSQDRWTLRWFTPVKEVPLCGHATLASAHVIFNLILKKKGLTNVDNLTFETKFKGNLEAAMDWSTGHIALNFPANPPAPLTNSGPWLEKVVAATITSKIPRELVQDVLIPPELGYLFLRLKSTGDPVKNGELIEKLEPNFAALLAATTVGSVNLPLSAVMVTIQGWTEQGAGKPQFFSRFFAPWSGIDEDPVTGSAHTILTPYWLEEYRKQGVSFDGGEIMGHQLSARKGEVRCSMAGNDNDRVKLVGQSRLGMSGTFYPV